MAIPKTIHFLWMSKEKDEKTLLCLNSWKKYLEGYEIREWNSETFPYNDFLWTKEATQAKKWAYVTDYFRVWVLYNYGGIYMDADVLLQKNFDDFLDCQFFCGTEFTLQIGAHCMGAEKGHPYVKKCLDFYQNRSFKDIIDRKILQSLAMPRIMTYLLYKNYKIDTLSNFSDNPISLSDGIKIYSDNYFTIDVSDGKNVGIHFGLGSWRDNTTTVSPIYLENLEQYFVKRFYLKDAKKLDFLCGWKYYLFLFLPSFLVIQAFKFKLKIKNSKTIMNIKNFIK